jgi:hypothetical protein
LKLVGAGSQQAYHPIFDASGTIASGSAPQLLLPHQLSRSLFMFTNNSAAVMYMDFDGARATATLTSGAVSGTTITNAGFGYTKPPLVRFMGGGAPQGLPFSGAYPQGVSTQVGPNNGFVGSSIPDPSWPSPPNPATGVAVMTGSAPNLSVASITITNPGAYYLYAPFVWLINSDLDPSGAAIASATSGFAINPGGSVTFNGTVCPTGAVSLFCATATSAFTCKYMP